MFAQGESATDSYAFTVGAADENTYLSPDNTGSHFNGKRYADKTRQILYIYPIKHYYSATSFTWTSGIHQQAVIAVSADGDNWTEIYRYEGEANDKGLAEEERAFTFAVPDGLQESRTLYIRLTDAYTDTGYGPALTDGSRVTLRVAYDPTAAEPEVPEERNLLHEQYVFTVCDDSEKEYLQVAGQQVTNSGIRYADRGNFFIYKYTIKASYGVKKITWTSNLYQQAVLEVSQDGENWQEVYRYVGKADDTGLTAKQRVMDLTEYLDTIKNRTIYLRISDAYTTSGYGGAISRAEPVVLDVAYEELTDEEKNTIEETVTEHSVPLFGCHTEQGRWQLNQTDMMFGASCLSLLVKNGEWKLSQTFDSRDISKMDTMEFYLYVANTGFWNRMAAYSDTVNATALTISSDGKTAKDALSWSLTQITNGAVDGLQPGWNHIKLRLSDAAKTGDINLSRVNGLFLCLNSNVSGNIMIDNFSVTDDFHMQRLAVSDDADALIGAIEEIGTLTQSDLTDTDAAGRAAIARTVSDARVAYDKMDAITRSLVDESGASVKLRENERTIWRYLKSLKQGK